MDTVNPFTVPWKCSGQRWIYTPVALYSVEYLEIKIYHESSGRICRSPNWQMSRELTTGVSLTAEDIQKAGQYGLG